MSGPELVVAVDGGQSSTTCLVGDLTGRPLGWASSGPIWHLGEVGGPQRVRDAIQGAITGALDRAGRTAADVARAHLSLTGACGFAAEVAGELLGAATITAASDALGGLASGTFGEPGVAIVTGTGSVAVAVDEQGREVCRGGWGPILGDQGSAYQIGLDALRSVALADDRTGPDTALRAAVTAELGIGAPRDLFDLVYTRALDRVGIAALAPLVVDLARTGDSVAGVIVAEAVRALIDLAVAVASAVELSDEHQRVVLAGGVLQGSAEIADAVSTGITERLPHFEVIRPACPPLIGAYALGLRACGVDAVAVLTSRVSAPGWPPELTNRNCSPYCERI